MNRYSLVGAVAIAAAALLLLAACAPLPTLNALVPSDSYRLDKGVPYGPLPRQKLDVYRPQQTPPADGFPLAVFFYGGSWNNGERADYRFVGEALAARGIVAVIPDYRLYPEVTYPAFLEDSARALAYGMREAGSLGADPTRVFVMGHSAGGYNAAMLALDDRWLQAQGEHRHRLAGWIGLAGPYDFLPIENPDAKPVFHHPNYPPNTQPIKFDLAGSPPSFIGAAQDDKLVNPQRNAAQMVDRLRNADVPVTYRVYPRANHLTLAGAFAWPLRWLAPVADDVAGFIKSPLGSTAPVAAAPGPASQTAATNGAR